MSPLHQRGAIVSYCEPHVAEVQVNDTRYTHIPKQEALEVADLMLLTADHAVFDMPRIVERATLIVDTRNATRQANPSPEQKQKIYGL